MIDDSTCLTNAAAQRELEEQLETEKQAKEKALEVLATVNDNNGAQVVKQIEEERKRLEQERNNAEMVPQIFAFNKEILIFYCRKKGL